MLRREHPYEQAISSESIDPCHCDRNCSRERLCLLPPDSLLGITAGVWVGSTDSMLQVPYSEAVALFLVSLVVTWYLWCLNALSNFCFFFLIENFFIAFTVRMKVLNASQYFKLDSYSSDTHCSAVWAFHTYLLWSSKLYFRFRVPGWLGQLSICLWLRSWSQGPGV